MAKTVQKVYHRLNLNLLYPQGIPQKIPVRFLKWLITYGRFIVVGVEILVLGGFLLRFKFDAELADLKEKINAQVPYIESLQSDEAVIRQTQLRVDTIKNVFHFSPSFKETLDRISAQTPKSVKVTTVNLNNKTPNSIAFIVTAQSTSNNDLAFFIKDLKSEPKLKEVNLTNINLDQGRIIFTITGVSQI